MMAPMSTTGFRARTGARHYDEIRFSQEVSASSQVHASTGIAICNHDGAPSDALIDTYSCHDTSLSFLMSTGSAAHYCGHIGDAVIERPFCRYDVLLVPPGMVTEFRFPAYTRSLIVAFPLDAVAALFPEAEPRALRPRYFPISSLVHQKLAMIADEIASPGFASDLFVDGLARAILAPLLHPEARVADARGDLPKRVATAIDYIEANLEQRLTLDQIARAADVSLFHFARLFHTATGEAPYRYVLKRRIERAQHLLVAGEKPLATLALDCGFSSQSHFTAAFKRVTGLSPARWASQARTFRDGQTARS